MNAATVSPHPDVSARAHHAGYRAGILSGVVAGIAMVPIMFAMFDRPRAVATRLTELVKGR